MQFVVTTSNKASEESIKKAISLAQRLQLPFVHRSKVRNNPEQVLIIVSLEDIFIRYQNKNLSWHPNMAKLRILNLMRNGQDPLITAVDPQPGDHILDCTMGLGADSLVLAYSVGPTGKITALESEKLVAVLAENGFAKLNDTILKPLTQRIEIINSSFHHFLNRTPGQSFDVIYFDPMFQITKSKSTGINILRLIGNPTPLMAADVQLALSKCRRQVVVKENLNSDFFKNFRPDQLIKTSSNLGFGIYYSSKQEG
ncbi:MULTISPECIES: class I SAM-dependent methyltransferase [Carboxydocella]|uniref:SAM-dependent methyltransferase n=2 Tax=Carboxydocella TaxID=178898 RepID=A0A2R4N0R5_CARTR|nr:MULTISPECIES: class I SAM-dependent methyltransferase [Carboxydocella]AVX20637.1 Putative SAM-dependent methyltransferase [Carboxydocella thermautotrophica]AVX31059.1 Putative SAM-dependent methyltransferase [Carboxydocella thermautotrophica]SJZ58772.1 Putative SAM-dependent methyltransferase [Carboxydocella sporoproducens DSM 16521]GAW27959.1 hypothetical protein ULO1_05290 [Carboxydocella sp. ULO1]GAW31565.1 hypothetical protein JDF658_13300 [Carboxydocella sp. JDF658]